MAVVVMVVVGERRWSCERGERPLINGNIRKPEESYVNGSVIKAL